MKVMEIMNSATRIVLLALTAALIGLAFTQPAYQGLFESVMIAVISFYFGQKTRGTDGKKEEIPPAQTSATEAPKKGLDELVDVLGKVKQ